MCLILSVQNFWESQEKKISNELSDNREIAAERMWFLSFLSLKLHTDPFLQSSMEKVIKLGYSLFEVNCSLKLFDQAHEAMENLAEFLNENEVKRKVRSICSFLCVFQVTC